jgi:hypothetical protein
MGIRGCRGRWDDVDSYSGARDHLQIDLNYIIFNIHDWR